MNLGAMLHVNGKLKEAEKSYLAALKLRPNDNTTKQNLAKLRNLMGEKKGTWDHEGRQISQDWDQRACQGEQPSVQSKGHNSSEFWSRAVQL